MRSAYTLVQDAQARQGFALEQVPRAASMYRGYLRLARLPWPCPVIVISDGHCLQAVPSFDAQQTYIQIIHRRLGRTYDRLSSFSKGPPQYHHSLHLYMGLIPCLNAIA